MPRSKLELDAIDHHVDEANKAVQIASALLTEAIGPLDGGLPIEQWLEVSVFKVAVATASARVADTHIRLLEVKLAVGDSAL